MLFLFRPVLGQAGLQDLRGGPLAPRVFGHFQRFSGGWPAGDSRSSDERLTPMWARDLRGRVPSGVQRRPSSYPGAKILAPSAGSLRKATRAWLSMAGSSSRNLGCQRLADQDMVRGVANAIMGQPPIAKAAGGGRSPPVDPRRSELRRGTRKPTGLHVTRRFLPRSACVHI